MLTSRRTRSDNDVWGCRLVLDPTCVRVGTGVLTPPRSPRQRGDSGRDGASLPVDGEG